MRVFTEQDMRKVAKSLLSSEVNLDFDKRDIAAMLRQAADEKIRLDSILDAIEKEFKKQSTCRSCEWRGKLIRGEPACPCDKDKNFSVYDIDIIDRLRKADGMEREKKYEYIVRFFSHGNCVDRYTGHYDTIAEAKLNNTFCMLGDVRKIFRRSVGEWEEVK